jgi:hypothetical protein
MILTCEIYLTETDERGIKEMFVIANKNTCRFCFIQSVPKKEDESITPLFIGRF